VEVLLRNARTNAEVSCGFIGATALGGTARVTCDDTIKANQVIVKGGDGNLHFAEIKAWGKSYDAAYPPVDCQGSWTVSETCTAGTNGYQTETYAITVPAENDGNACPFNDAATRTTECIQPVDVEFTVDETVESFTAEKQQDFRQAIADSLNIAVSQVTLTVGAQANPIGRRLTAGGLVITVTIEVYASEIVQNLDTIESDSFATAVAAASSVQPTFLQLKPAHGSNICATCEWENGKISVTHYINSQGAGESGLQHKCYHDGSNCICQCREPAQRFAEVICGRPNRCGNNAGGFVDENELHEVRCCADRDLTEAGDANHLRWRQCPADNNVWAESHVPTCFHSKTYNEAKDICAAEGARLCTAVELEAGCASSTGCGHDSDLVWANREPGLHHRVSPTGTYHTQQPFGGGTYRDDVALNGRIPEAVCGRPGFCGNQQDGFQARDALHEVRCCADRDLTEPTDPNSRRWAQCFDEIQDGRNVGIWAESHVPNCAHSKTYEEAEAICGADGARLCKKSEIAAGCTRGTGCGHDSDLVWTRN
jgi:hypothetical protein